MEEKAKHLGEKAKAKSKQLIDTAMNKVFPDQEPVSFSIRSIVKDFKQDKDIAEIRGIQIDNNFIYVEYCVYTGPKQRVLRGVNRIVAEKVNDYSSDAQCYPVSTDTFYADIAPNEKHMHTTFFWNFERLKDFEVYTCVKAPLRHYIIFDSHSDTVYHRIEELRD